MKTFAVIVLYVVAAGAGFLALGDAASFFQPAYVDTQPRPLGLLIHGLIAAGCVLLARHMKKGA